MRIISQNGMIDVPYEMVAFHVAEGTIRMNMVGDTGKGSAMAIYTEPEKAEKAMNMLHEVYTGMILLRNLEMSEEDFEQLKRTQKGFFTLAFQDGGNANIEPMNIVWRFPQEDEI